MLLAKNKNDMAKASASFGLEWKTKLTVVMVFLPGTESAVSSCEALVQIDKLLRYVIFHFHACAKKIGPFPWDLSKKLQC